MRPATGVGVLVPAHDEIGSIAACVRSILTALEGVPAARALCVVADRCTDGTAWAAADAAARHPAAGRVRTAVLHPLPAPVGALRSLGARTALRALGTDPTTTWLLSTDADGTVTPDWVRSHLALAAAGADAVAGGVLLDLPGRGVPPGEPPWPSYPVYGANLGVRADAFARVGGFPPVARGEDHGLVDRLRAAGYQVVSGAAGTVRTSARTRGRARGGLADLLGARPESPDGSAGVTDPGAGTPVA